MEIWASLGILSAFLAALLYFLEVLVDVLPLLLASLGVPIVPELLHRARYLLPQWTLGCVFLVF